MRTLPRPAGVLAGSGPPVVAACRRRGSQPGSPRVRHPRRPLDRGRDRRRAELGPVPRRGGGAGAVRGRGRGLGRGRGGAARGGRRGRGSLPGDARSRGPSGGGAILRAPGGRPGPRPRRRLRPRLRPLLPQRVRRRLDARRLRHAGRLRPPGGAPVDRRLRPRPRSAARAPLPRARDGVPAPGPVRGPPDPRLHPAAGGGRLRGRHEGLPDLRRGPAVAPGLGRHPAVSRAAAPARAGAAGPRRG